MKHLFILNPVAGGGKNTAAVQTAVQSVMPRWGAPWELYRTRGPMDACRKIKAEAERGAPLRVYACGGDGTLNECVNGAALRENVAVTHFPMGTGNDFIKLFDTGREDFFRLEALLCGKEMPLDIIDCGGRYGINICSVGIDARIGTSVHAYSRLPFLGGKTGYLVSMVVNVIKGIATELEVEAEGRVYRKSFSLVCACNGRFYGGAFNPVPEALPDDGLMDILLVDAVSRLRIAGLVGKYAAGRYRELGDLVTHVKSRELTIRSPRELVVNVDGEAVYAKEITFSVRPGGVTFVAPQSATFHKMDTFQFVEKREKGENKSN